MLKYLIYLKGILYLLSISFTRGFRAGGVNAQELPVGIPQKFDPEYSNNYEIGCKTLASGNQV